VKHQKELGLWRVNCSKHLNKIYYLVKKRKRRVIGPLYTPIEAHIWQHFNFYKILDKLRLSELHEIYIQFLFNTFGNIYLFCIYYMITLEYNNWVNFFCSIFTNATFQIVRYRRVMLSIFRCLTIIFINLFSHTL
jgi:hypothetical protein